MEYTVQVNKEESFNIQPIEVGYFDTKSAKYVVLKSAPINLKGNLIEVAKSNSNGTTKVITESKIDSNNTGGESNVGNNEEFLWISISSLILIAGFIFFAGRIKKPTKIAFDDSIVVNEPIISITWKDVDECLSTAKIAFENNDRNNFLLALENALLIALKVTLNEQYTHKTTKELIKDLSRKMGENNFLIDLTNSYEICQNARYGFDENSNDLASLLSKIQAQIENLKKL